MFTEGFSLLRSSHEDEAEELDGRGGSLATKDQRGTVARAEDEMNEERDTDARLGTPGSASIACCA